jgi:hypothetical protein
MKFALIVVVLALFSGATSAPAKAPPEVARLRAQNAALRAEIIVLHGQINQLYSDITDCVSKLPYPAGP